MRATVVPIEEKVAMTTCKLPQGPYQSQGAPTMKVFNTTPSRMGTDRSLVIVLKFSDSHYHTVFSSGQYTKENWRNMDGHQ